MREKESFTKQPTRKLNDLDAYTKYFIKIYAENKHGRRSQPATVEAVTASGGKAKFNLWEQISPQFC